MPTQRQMQAFIATIDCQSMRGAADKLGISQPSISKHINTLEREVGKPLFERKRGARISLSRDGQALEMEIRELHARSKRLSQGASNPDQPKEITLYIRHFLYSMIEDRLLEFGDLSDATKIVFEPVGSTMPILETIAREKDAAAFVRLTSIATHADVEGHLISVDPCSLYASTAWFDTLADESDALKQATIFLPGTGDLHWWMYNQLIHAGVDDSQIDNTSWHPAAVLKKTLAGDGATVFLDEHVKPHVDAGKLKALDLKLGPLFLQLLTNSQMPKSLATELSTRIKTSLL